MAPKPLEGRGGSVIPPEWHGSGYSASVRVISLCFLRRRIEKGAFRVRGQLRVCDTDGILDFSRNV